ncbi:MAG: hypothetical protein M3237_12085 [Actinomycetota bacterium]|nr:hypothetical protein [Actinomycetota bacterium]
MKMRYAGGAAALPLLLMPAGASAAPTCSETLGISNHGQHIVGDYVTGTGHDQMSWPPAGQVGSTVAANGGAAVPGGPGPGFHFANGFAPGASFCNGSNSPGVHL